MDSIQYMKCRPISCIPRLQASVVLVEFAHLVNLASIVFSRWPLWACTFSHASSIPMSSILHVASHINWSVVPFGLWLDYRKRLNMESIQYMEWGPISCTPRLQASVVVVEFAHLVNLASMDNLILNTCKIYVGPACTFIWTTYYHTYVLSFQSGDAHRFTCFAWR
jgi:hypothetical protein